MVAMAIPAIATLVTPRLLDAQAAATTTRAATLPQAGPPTTPDVFLVPLVLTGTDVKVGVPANLTRRDGYDNQPSFAANSRELFYTSVRNNGPSDIYRYDFNTGLSVPARLTSPESEYSSFPMDGGKALAVIRVEADSAQRLWRMPLDASAPTVLFPDIKPVGYFAQADDSTWAMFVLGTRTTPATLQIGVVGRPGALTVARDIGRSLHRIPGTNRVSYVQKGANGWYVMQLDPYTKHVDTLIKTVDKAEDMAWVDSTTVVMGQGTKLYAWRRGAANWTQIADFSFAHLAGITRVAVSPNRQYLAIVADVVPRAVVNPAVVFADKFDAATIQKDVNILAADSMEGRYTGSRGGARAAKWISEQFKSAGLTAAGDSNTFLQRIPLQRAAPQQVMPGSGAVQSSQARPSAVTSWAQWDSLPVANRLQSSNVVGVLQGSDPVLKDEIVLVTAHYDHIGFGRAVDGDSINNGADDDASGVTALIEMAKALRKGPKPKRTIVFMAITGEEVGGFGTRWYIAHPTRPLDKTIVDLNVEMIAHVDSLAGGFGKAWLTGYERSTMGDLLSDNGIPLVPDPRPTQRFFERSDNVAFARIGIPAHSLSSYNLLTPYHHPKDEASIIDAPHMAQVIGATARALRLLADGVKPEWHPGGRPDAPAPRAPR